MIELSVIFPTRNRAESLARALASVRTQTLAAERFEVLVVDNGSTDATREVAAAAAREAPNVRYLHEPTPGLHAARHRGLHEARADVLTYADDDIAAFPGWLAAIRTSVRDAAVALVGGKNLPVYETDPPRWLRTLWERPCTYGRALGYLSILDFGEQPRPIPPHYVWGCNFTVRRSVLVAAGGFHPDGLPAEQIEQRGDGETWVADYVALSGREARYVPDAAVHHHIPATRMTVDFFCRRAYNQGISDSYTLVRSRSRESYRRRVRFLRLVYLAKRLLVRLPAATEVAGVRKRMWRSSLEGFNFHRRRLRESRELREWVVRESYMDA